MEGVAQKRNFRLAWPACGSPIASATVACIVVLGFTRRRNKGAPCEPFRFCRCDAGHGGVLTDRKEQHPIPRPQRGLGLCRLFGDGAALHGLRAWVGRYLGAGISVPNAAPPRLHLRSAIHDSHHAADRHRGFAAIVQLARRGVELSGGGLAALGLGASANALNSVTLEFKNVRVEQLSFQSLDTIVEELGPQCKRSLENFKRQGIAKQTQQALRADVTYKADFKAGASADVKNAVIQSLAAGFGASVERQSNSIIEGTGLYYGVILRDLRLPPRSGCERRQPTPFVVATWRRCRRRPRAR